MDSLTFANLLQKSQWPSPSLERSVLLKVRDIPRASLATSAHPGHLRISSRQWLNLRVIGGRLWAPIVCATPV